MKLTREEIIDILIDLDLQGQSEDHNYLRNTLKYGWQGYDKMTNQELMDAHNEGLEDDEIVEEIE